MRSLHWFRADLRMIDNTALNEAIINSNEILAVFIIPIKTWQRHDAAPIKIQFILNNLIVLSEKLWRQGIPLLIKTMDYFSDCPKILADICQKYKINQVYFNKQYEVDELRRDALVASRLSQLNIKTHVYDDQLILPPNSILSKQHTPLKIFTPFKKIWLTETARLSAWIPCQKSNKKFAALAKPDLVPNKVKGFDCQHSLAEWPAGEDNAKKLLKKFCDNHLDDYHQARDFPSIHGTSKLSPYLAQGVLSPRQCVKAILDYLDVGSFGEIQYKQGASMWLSELIWREFYKHIMHHFPDICRHKPFILATDKLSWNYNHEHFQAWCEGQTGFPLVDAALRQLNQTGWMHNRLRMVTAMFLSKTLFLDWRLGEKYFMQHLIDGDLAANNGGWQWCTSTGTDAAPYFRIFNPITQSERFDPEGRFIRQYCPELASLDNKTIHDPFQRGASKEEISYPEKIVDYNKMRLIVLEAFKKLK